MEAFNGEEGWQRMDALLRVLAAKDEQDVLLNYLPSPAHEILTVNNPLNIRFLESFYGINVWSEIMKEAFGYFSEVASVAPSCDLLGHAHLNCPVDCIQLGEVNKSLGSYTLRLVKCPIPAHPRKVCILPVVIYRSTSNCRYLGRVIHEANYQASARRITTTWPRPLPTPILPGTPMGTATLDASPPVCSNGSNTLLDQYIYADDTLQRPPRGRDGLISIRQFYINNLVNLLE